MMVIHETHETEKQTADVVLAAKSAREKADAAELSASPYQWVEADAYAGLAGLGWTQQRIAEACGTTQPRVTAALLLVNNATETDWFQRAAALCSAICFPDNRVRFVDAAGRARGTPLQGQGLFYFGKEVARFTSIFRPYGICLSVADSVGVVDLVDVWRKKPNLDPVSGEGREE
jgi:hypothetical protein